MLKKFMMFVLIAAISLPLAVVLTLFFTFPFWRWFEAATGIESYGHSGPAEWCYAATYVLLIIIFSVFWYFTAKPKAEE